ncbi:insecticidal delta-endotoxin Cry8Ea1 family protein, partial [Bacillus cereus]
MNYKDWQNKCADITSQMSLAPPAAHVLQDAAVLTTGVVAVALSVSFPVVGAIIAGISLFLTFLWPQIRGSENSNSQVAWDTLMDAAEVLMKKEINNLQRVRAISHLKIVQSRLNDYKQALCNWENNRDHPYYKQEVIDAFDDADDVLKSAMIIFSETGFEELMLTSYVQGANLHLLLLRDVVKYGESWGIPRERVQQYYSNTGVGNPGLLQLLARYTDYCMKIYNKALAEYKPDPYPEYVDYYTYRTNMTLLVLDVVAVWPTYDVRLYPSSPLSQLTREVYSRPIGMVDSSYSPPPIPSVDEQIYSDTWERTPTLFRWLEKATFYTENQRPAIGGDPTAALEQFRGLKLGYKNTLASYGWEFLVGDNTTAFSWNVDISPGQDIYMVENIVHGHYHMGFYIDDPIMQFFFNSYPPQNYIVVGKYLEGNRQWLSFGMPCINKQDDCSTCTPCEWNAINTESPCTNPAIASHRLSSISTVAYKNFWIEGDIISRFSYGWTHVSADGENVIDTERITRMPAVKAYNLENGAVVSSGPGSTGGNLIAVHRNGSFRIKLTGKLLKGYQLRVRYASASSGQLQISRQVNKGGAWTIDYSEYQNVEQTYMLYPIRPLQYESFSYLTMEHVLPSTTYAYWDMTFSSYGDDPLIIDKIDFIPIEGS